MKVRLWCSAGQRGMPRPATIPWEPILRSGTYLEEVEATIMSPDLVFQSTRDARSRVFYRLRAGRGDFAGKHLVVIVKYAQQPDGRRGYVSTVYLSRAVYAQGALLWPRTESAPR